MVFFTAGQKLGESFPVAAILIFSIIPLIIGSMASHRSISTVNDFFIYDRNMGTLVSFFTVYATWWSSFAFLGSISYFYSIGSVYWTAIGWNVLFGILYMLFGIKVCRYGRQRGYITPINFFDDIYHSQVLNKTIIIIMVIFTIPHLQMQFYGGAIIIDIATGGLIPWKIGALMFYIVMVIYIWAGGLRAIAWTDIFYTSLTFFGMIAGGVILISAAGGVDNTFQQLISHRPDLILLPKGSADVGISMWISMFFILPLGEVMSPQMWLRMYSTKEQKTFYIMPLLLSLATIAYLGSMLAGSAASILAPDGIETADTILPYLLVQHAPSWLMVIVLCCGAAACLSTANSEIHAASSLLTLDVYKKFFRPKATEKHIVFIAKLIIVGFSAITYLSLIQVGSPLSIVNFGLISFSGIAQTIVPVIGAFFWEKSNAKGAILGILTGILFTFVFSTWDIMPLPVHPGLIALGLNGIVFLLCGLFLEPNEKTSRKIAMYRNGDFKEH